MSGFSYTNYSQTNAQSSPAISNENSTSIPLAENITFRGEWVDVSSWASISIIGSADQPGTLWADFSIDGATTEQELQLSNGLTGNFGIHTLSVVAQYFRIRLINGPVAQGSLNIQVILNPNSRITLPTTRRNQTLDLYDDVLNVRAVISGERPNGSIDNVSLDEESSLKMTLSGPIAAFGSLRTSAMSPLCQIDAVYGILDNVKKEEKNGGSASTDNANFVCQTGVNSGGYASITSKRPVRYRAGQGLVFKFTALFDEENKVANSVQLAGAFNPTNGYFVGLNGASEFGIMHRTGGRHEVRTITVTVAASGNETLIVTLNGVIHNIPLTVGSIQHNAYQISKWLNSNQSIWHVQQIDSTVVLIGLNPEPLAGAYSIANGGGTSAGNIVQNKAGVVNEETWVYQGDFKYDQLDGSGTSGFSIDHAKGNVFEINIQYLGYGAVEMKCENPETGKFFTFHRFIFSNEREIPTLLNPTLRVGWLVKSLGSTTNLTVKGASGLGAIDGRIHPFGTPRGFSYQRSNVGSTLTSVFAIRSREVFKNIQQESEILPKILSVAVNGNKACEVKLLLNPTFNSAVADNNWQYINSNSSIACYDITGTTFTDNGQEIGSFVIAGGQSGTFSFADLTEAGINPVYIVNGDLLVIAARIVGGSGDSVTASLTWIED